MILEQWRRPIRSYPKDVNSVVVGTKIFTERHQESAHLTNTQNIQLQAAVLRCWQQIEWD